MEIFILLFGINLDKLERHKKDNRDITFSGGTNIINYLIINSIPNERRYIAG
jgi:hypothetical protein